MLIRVNNNADSSQDERVKGTGDSEEANGSGVTGRRSLPGNLHNVIRQLRLGRECPPSR